MSRSPQEDLILTLLNRAGRELTGYEMVKISDGVLRRGMIYVRLQMMEQKRTIRVREVEPTAPDGLRQWFYRPFYKVVR